MVASLQKRPDNPIPTAERERNLWLRNLGTTRVALRKEKAVHW